MTTQSLEVNCGEESSAGVIAYRFYTFSGGISSIVTIALLIFYEVNKDLRVHPNGIIRHIIFSLSIISGTYLLNGIV